ncbi:hypothetical protein [Streptomyces sp. ISL-11]|uniref:hypothetical protein n=1 Tax=Streptomyces sp. ISL-11 TaxID=2819174 RepID=UPI001BE5FD74|nr:hypothetical protein [Streptomyces sp. ISL-11]MBT2386541.1 hypothetical protein [Streptomyces sp. ISL-11]
MGIRVVVLVVSGDTGPAGRELVADLARGYNAGDLHRAQAFQRLVGRAAEAYGIALHDADDGDLDTANEAMSRALEAVAQGFAASALEGVAQDEVLGLSAEQKLRMGELAAGLDLETAEFLRGT